MKIGGDTILYPVLGYPVSQVKAPRLFNAYFETAGIDAVVVAMAVPPEFYPGFLRTLFSAENVRGALITIPHKKSTVDMVDDCSLVVRLAGACNAVVRKPDGRLYGELFDGIGFVRSLNHAGFDQRGARCLLVGCGGAGAAIAAQLAISGVGELALHDYYPASAQALAARLAGHAGGRIQAVEHADPAGYDLVINATPLGMDPADPLPVDVAGLAASTLVADIVMKVDVTPLLAAASERGCRTLQGKEMLLEQAPLYLEMFGYPGVSASQLRPEQ